MKIDSLYKSIDNEDVKNFIERIPKDLKDKCKIKTIENRKIVVLKGNEIKSIYISCKGSMQVKNEFENGFIYSFASIDPISYIGIIELMADKKNYSSTLQATTECIIIEIPKEDFLKWIINDKELLLEVLKFVSKSMYEQSIKRGEGFAYPSICSLIDYLITAYKSEDKEEVFLQKTREEIASILGVSVRTVNRSLKELKEQELITVTRKSIIINKKNYNDLYKELEKFKL